MGIVGCRFIPSVVDVCRWVLLGEYRRTARERSDRGRAGAGALLPCAGGYSWVSDQLRFPCLGCSGYSWVKDQPGVPNVSKW